jgi:hypothetical protein
VSEREKIIYSRRSACTIDGVSANRNPGRRDHLITAVSSRNRFPPLGLVLFTSAAVDDPTAPNAARRLSPLRWSTFVQFSNFRFSLSFRRSVFSSTSVVFDIQYRCVHRIRNLFPTPADTLADRRAPRSFTDDDYYANVVPLSVARQQRPPTGSFTRQLRRIIYLSND